MDLHINVMYLSARSISTLHYYIGTSVMQYLAGTMLDR